MNVALNVTVRPPVLSREQFLDWIQHQEGRFELANGRPVAMTGGNAQHNIIAGNIYAPLRSLLRGSSYRVFIADVGVGTAASSVRYPDVMVTASRGSGNDRIMDDAILVIEVISPNSARIDRVTKLREYLAIPSIHRYIIAEQTSAALTVFERDETGTAWRATALGAGETLELPEIGATLLVADIYEGVELPDEPTASEPLA